jgi:hypothetical protein
LEHAQCRWLRDIVFTIGLLTADKRVSSTIDRQQPAHPVETLGVELLAKVLVNAESPGKTLNTLKNCQLPVLQIHQKR